MSCDAVLSIFELSSISNESDTRNLINAIKYLAKEDEYRKQTKIRIL